MNSYSCFAYNFTQHLPLSCSAVVGRSDFTQTTMTVLVIDSVNAWSLHNGFHLSVRFKSSLAAIFPGSLAVHVMLVFVRSLFGYCEGSVSSCVDLLVMTTSILW